MDSYGEFAYIYDELMNDIDYSQWMRFYENFLPKSLKEPYKIVDLACGTGNLTIPLAKRGYHVIGIDVSQDMLRVAMEKARQQGLRIPFVCQDIRDIYLPSSVDCMMCGCDGINYLTTIEDVKKCFHSVFRYLKDGGIFIFDISSHYKIEHIIGNEFFGEDRDDIAYLWKNEYNKESRMCLMDISFFIRQGEQYRKFREYHYQRAHDVEEISACLTEKGFSIKGIYDSFTFQSPGLTSERVHFVAKKI